MFLRSFITTRVSGSTLFPELYFNLISNSSKISISYSTGIPKAWVLACIVQGGCHVVGYKEELENKGEKADLSINLFTWVMTTPANKHCFTQQGIYRSWYMVGWVHPYCSSKLFGSFCPLCFHIPFIIRLSNAVKKILV